MKLSEIKAMRRTVPVQFGPHTVNVTYKMDGFTGSMGTALVDELLVLLDSWDLTDDTGEPIPITAETLRNEVPWPFLKVVEEVVLKDAQPGNLNGTRSRSG